MSQTEPSTPLRPRGRIGNALFGVGLAIGVLLPVVGRALWEGRRELALADEAAAAEDFDAEVEHLGRAARWRLPGARHDDLAIERLMALGAEAEATGEGGTQRALAAYREARGALLGSRGFRVPQAERFHQANERVATLMAAQEERFGTDVGGTGDPYTYHLGLLEEVPGPLAWRAWGAAVAFAAWIVASIGFFVRALDDRGRLHPARAVRWGAAVLALLGLWLVALRFAS